MHIFNEACRKPLARSRRHASVASHIAKVLAGALVGAILLAGCAPLSASAAPSALTRDGLAKADVADCVIVGDLSQYHFQTNDTKLFIDRPGKKLIYLAYTPKSGTTSFGAGKWFQLDYQRALLDTSGRYHDLHIRFSNVQARWGTDPKLGAIRHRMVTCYTDRISVDAINSWTTDSSYKSVSSSQSNNAAFGLKANIEMWADGTDDDAPLAYNIFVTDLDVADKFTGKFGDPWCESIALGDTFGTVHVEPNTYLSLKSGRIVGSTLDNNSYRSGFVSRAMMSADTPLKLTWTASQAGTSFFINWSHVITAKAGKGGSIAIGTGSSVMLDTPTHAATDGVHQTQTELEAVPSNDYVVVATPDFGYDLEGITLDGKAVDSDGTLSLPAISADHTVCATFVPKRGRFGIEKAPSDPSLTSQNGSYSLEGACYSVYADEACTQLEAELTTNEQGTTDVVELPLGTHWVKETKAPRGYALDHEVHSAEVTAGSTTLLPLVEVPQTAMPQVIVQKVDAQTKKSEPQGSASLAGATFEVSFYAGQYERENLPDEPTRRWVFATDQQGQAHLDDSSLVDGDELYRDAEGTAVLPLGTIVITETGAPAGYTLPSPNTPQVIRIESAGTEATVSFEQPSPEHPTVADEVARGGLAVYKRDAHNDTGLAGAQFDLINRSEASVVIGNKEFEPGEACLTITSDEKGRAATDKHVLPPGTYEIRERTAPRGYLLDPTWSLEATIDASGTFVDLTDSPLKNERVTVKVPLKAIKSFDGTSQGRTLEEGMFTFELCTKDGEVLQTTTNDASGAIIFEPLSFDYRDLESTHTYQLREVRGSDEEIVYDAHTEEFTITLAEQDNGSLSYKLETDDDGLVFHNRTVSALEMPFTGLAGQHRGLTGALLSLVAGGLILKLKTGGLMR